MKSEKKTRNGAVLSRLGSCVRSRAEVHTFSLHSRSALLINLAELSTPSPLPGLQDVGRIAIDK